MAWDFKEDVERDEETRARASWLTKIRLTLICHQMSLCVWTSLCPVLCHTMSSTGESSSSAPLVDSASSNRPSRQRQIPSRFRDRSDDSDENDRTLCALCNLNEPNSLATSTVFWIGCNDCGCWVHNVCAFGNNTVSRQYICNTCSKK